MLHIGGAQPIRGRRILSCRGLLLVEPYGRRAACLEALIDDLLVNVVEVTLADFHLGAPAACSLEPEGHQRDYSFLISL